MSHGYTGMQLGHHQLPLVLEILFVERRVDDQMIQKGDTSLAELTRPDVTRTTVDHTIPMGSFWVL